MTADETSVSGEPLTDRQRVAWLRYASEPRDLAGELERERELSSEVLRSDVQKALLALGLSIEDTAKMVGVLPGTVERWLRTADELPEDVKRRLAGLNLLLSLDSEEPSYEDAVAVVRGLVAGEETQEDSL